MNKIIASALALVVAASLCACGNTSNGVQNDYNVNGTYQIEVKGQDGANSTIFCYEFNKDSMRYTQGVAAGNLSSDLDQGTYVIDEEKAEVVCSSDNGQEQVFVIYGKYLVAKDYIYEADVPSGETFDLVAKYENGNSSSSIRFQKDGSYNTDKYAGTYKRSGDFIERTSETGQPMISMLVLDKGLSDAYYIKQE